MLATSKKLVIGVTITDLQMLHKIYVQFYSIVEVVVEDDCDSSNNSLYKTFVQGINSKKIRVPRLYYLRTLLQNCISCAKI